MNDKGINGSGLAYIWGKIKSTFATKQYVQNAIAGIGGSSGDGGSTVAVEEIVYVNASYNLYYNTVTLENYSADDLFNMAFAIPQKRLVLNLSLGGDTNKFLIPLVYATVDEELGFSSIVTVDYQEVRLSVTIKKNGTITVKVTILDEIITGIYDLLNNQVLNLSHKFKDIRLAYDSGRLLKVKLTIPLGTDENGQVLETYAVGELSNVLVVDGEPLMFEFAVLIKADFGYGEMVYYNTLQVIITDNTIVSLRIINTTMP